MLRLYVAAIALAAAAALAGSPMPRGSPSLAGLAALAAIVALRPVRCPSLGKSWTPTHPFLLAAVAALGPFEGALVGMAGVLGAQVGRRRSPFGLKTLFNLASVAVAAAAAGGAFDLLGGRTGALDPIPILPILGAAVVYGLLNTALLSGAVAMEGTGTGFAAHGTADLGISALSLLGGFSGAIAILAVLGPAPWAVPLVGLPPALLLACAYRWGERREPETARG